VKKDWDIFSDEEKIGIDIIKFIDKNGYEVVNDTLPTYHLQMANS
jgi:hypothetical protein